jgi:hypothetical protein
MMSRILVALIASAVLTAPAAAGAPVGLHESAALEPAASFVAGKPVKVFCATSLAAWNAFVAKTAAIPGSSTIQQGYQVNRFTLPGASTIQLSLTVCQWSEAAKLGAVPINAHRPRSRRRFSFSRTSR